MRLIDADALMRCIPVEEIVSRMVVASATTIEPDCKWIPVSERLPKEEGHYFVTDEAAGMAETQIDKYIRCDDGEWVWLYSQRVVAWMPLPAPYKEA